METSSLLAEQCARDPPTPVPAADPPAGLGPTQPSTLFPAASTSTAPAPATSHSFAPTRKSRAVSHSHLPPIAPDFGVDNYLSQSFRERPRPLSTDLSSNSCSPTSWRDNSGEDGALYDTPPSVPSVCATEATSISCLNLMEPTAVASSAGSRTDIIELDDLCAPKYFSEMVHDRNVSMLRDLGGLKGVATRLRTDYQAGLDLTDPHADWRKTVFGVNRLPDAKKKNIFQLVWDVAQEPMNMLFFALAVLICVFDVIGSIVFGRQSVNWAGDLNILVVIALGIIVGTVAALQRESLYSSGRRRVNFDSRLSL